MSWLKADYCDHLVLAYRALERAYRLEADEWLS